MTQQAETPENTEKDVQIKWPSVASIISYLFWGALISTAAIYFDGARGFAYIIVPITIALLLKSESNISWKTSKELMITFHMVIAIYFILGFHILLMVRSIEGGDPLSESGIIYNIAMLFINK